MAKAFCTKPGFDFSALREQGIEGIEFFTDGYTRDLAQVQEGMLEAMKSYRGTDVVVPTGSALHNFLLGFLFGRQANSVRVMVYSEGAYLNFHIDENPANTYHAFQEGQR